MEPLETEIGQRLRRVAIVAFLFGIVVSGSIGGCFIALTTHQAAFTCLGILMILAGIGLSWCLAMLIYGFARLVENSELERDDSGAERRRHEREERSRAATSAVQIVAAPPESENGEFLCPVCGALQDFGRTSCWSCGTIFQTRGGKAQQ